MNIRNEDVDAVTVEVPERHVHVRTTVRLKDGTELTFQEATVSNLLRAFVTVKTHPVVSSVKLRAVRLEEARQGYDQWQLLEVRDEDEGV